MWALMKVFKIKGITNNDEKCKQMRAADGIHDSNK